MKDKILKDIFNIKMDTSYEFKELYGLTFVFRRMTFIFKPPASSAEIRPAGIIYEENDQYYFAPLYGQENINEIVKNYVEDLKHNE